MGSIHLGHWNISYATVMRGNTANGKFTLGQFSVDHDNIVGLQLCQLRLKMIRKMGTFLQ